MNTNTVLKFWEDVSECCIKTAFPKTKYSYGVYRNEAFPSGEHIHGRSSESASSRKITYPMNELKILRQNCIINCCS